MNMKKMFPSKYLKSEDLNSEAVLTIDTVLLEEVGEEREEKPVLLFRESPKKLTLNKTNANTIAALYGEDTDDWEGKRITLYPTRVTFKGALVDSIRVRDQVPAADAKSSDIPF